MDNIPYYAFSMQLSQVVTRLPSEVIIEGDTGPFNARAVWDTGAMRSVITPEVVKSLNQPYVDFITVTGVNNVSRVPVVVVSVILPNSIRITGLKAAVCDMRQGIDMLIGMDIISMGDLALSNGGDKTFFSFAIPSFPDKIDFVDKAEKLNRERNTPVAGG
jgi:hypothetical protein